MCKCPVAGESRLCYEWKSVSMTRLHKKGKMGREVIGKTDWASRTPDSGFIVCSFCFVSGILAR
jgi:hypothetical protein